MINNALSSLRRLKHASTARTKRLMLGETKADIRLLVIGAQKGGTTSLYNYLSEHPDIEVPKVKEVNYFTSLGSRPASLTDFQRHFPTRYGRDNWFASIDVSPSYLIDAASAAQKIHTLEPSIKIVAVLREPVSRAVSSWFMYKKYYLEKPDWFIDAKWVRNSTIPGLNIVRRSSDFGKDFEADMLEEIDVLKSGSRIEYPVVEFGHYKSQLQHYLNVFERKNILILDSVELKHSTQNCLDQITSFIGLKSHPLSETKLVPHFVGDNKKPINPATTEGLAKYYHEENSGLEELLGQKLSWAYTNEI